MATKNEQLTLDKPSKQVEEVGKYWLTVVAASAENLSLDEMRDFNENWEALTAEPGGVDYVETDAGGVPAMWVSPKGCNEDRVVLYFHGGGFISGSMYTHRKLCGHFAKAIGCRVLIINYRRTPEYAYPAQIDDALAAYQWLLSQGITPGHIALAGDSAGGGLAIGVALLIRDKGLPLPAAIMPFSAWFDMESTGASLVLNSEKDLLFNIPWIQNMAAMYIGEKGDPRDPYASPLYAELAGLPPIYMHVGEDEMLLDDSVRLAERARNAGIDVSLDIFPGMQHSFQMAAGRAPEADDSISRFTKWVKPKLGLV